MTAEHFTHILDRQRLLLPLKLNRNETAPSPFPSPPLRGRGCRRRETGWFMGPKRGLGRGGICLLFMVAASWGALASAPPKMIATATNPEPARLP